MSNLGVVSDTKGFTAGWDWKGNYVNDLKSGDGLERFSQGSITPDTTLLFAGPARFSNIASDDHLHAMGLISNFNYSSNASVQPLYEIGSNRTFFTRGKTQHQIQVNSMMADHNSLMKVLSQEAYDEKTQKAKNGQYFVNTAGSKAPGVDGFEMNLDSEAFNLPFGLLMVFKTKGQEDGTDLHGKIVGATYLENCQLMNFNFGVDAQAPVIQENVAIMFDRAVPVAVR